MIIHCIVDGFVLQSEVHGLPWKGLKYCLHILEVADQFTENNWEWYVYSLRWQNKKANAELVSEVGYNSTI